MAYESLPKGIEVPEGEGDVNGRDRVTGKGKDGKETRGRFVDVGVFPMGIDVWALREKRSALEILFGSKLIRFAIEPIPKSKIGYRS